MVADVEAGDDKDHQDCANAWGCAQDAVARFANVQDVFGVDG